MNQGYQNKEPGILKQNIELNFPAVIYLSTLLEGIGNPAVGIRKMETDTGKQEKMEQGRVSIGSTNQDGQGCIILHKVINNQRLYTNQTEA